MTDSQIAIPDWLVMLVGRLVIEREAVAQAAQAAQAAQTNGVEEDHARARHRI